MRETQNYRIIRIIIVKSSVQLASSAVQNGCISIALADFNHLERQTSSVVDDIISMPSHCKFLRNINRGIYIYIYHGWKFSVSWLNSVTAAQIFFTISITNIHFQSQFSHNPSLSLSRLIYIYIYMISLAIVCVQLLDQTHNKEIV